MRCKQPRRVKAHFGSLLHEDPAGFDQGLQVLVSCQMPQCRRVTRVRWGYGDGYVAVRGGMLVQ